jgi:putative zinc finger/helix-turn-helix YgiT family protein
MEKELECPYCPGRALLLKEVKSLDYRKESFEVVAHYYKCSTCNEEFTTTASDEITINQLYNQYRNRHKILFPSEICRLREKYNMSAAKFSEVLGFGPNTISNYEKGEVPSSSSGALLCAAHDPAFVLSLVKQKLENDPDSSSYKRILKHLQTLVTHPAIPQQNCLNSLYESPSEFTGFNNFDPDRLKNVLILLLLSCSEKYNDRMKINKMLFYSDFLNYAKSGKSILGLKYRAIPYGPAPAFYDHIFTFMEQDSAFSVIDKDSIEGNVVELYKTEAKFDETLFTQDETSTLRSIIIKFKETSSIAIKDLSHHEKAWIDLSPTRSVISYQKYAFSLTAFN